MKNTAMNCTEQFIPSDASAAVLNMEECRQQSNLWPLNSKNVG
jgi:hypothetical protein